MNGADSNPNDSYATARRTVFLGLSIVLTAGGFVLLLKRYSGQPVFWEDYLVIALFPLLFGQIAIGFSLGLLGFYDWLRGGDPHHVMRGAWRKDEAAVPLAATAIVVPVYNEDVARVAAGIGNMWESLESTGQVEHFDVYICSDSSDANSWVEEECAWLALCRRYNAFGKIFYRKRRHRINGKSGNVADFCRRWGKRYRYMIILDADSVMRGATMVRLVRAMEANPQIGILQTQPYMVLGRSLFRRALQFSGQVYGAIFSQGCSFAQMSSASYWGHNAIIRVAPFIEHCDLPLLPVPDPGRRHVLSHDTVEAALMRRAGYEVWIAYDEPGSYEEGPPNITDMLIRDRRWCSGNLQHFWFLFARGIALGSRLQIWIGLMAYLCSPLWLLFMIAGSFSAYDRIRFLTLSAGPEDLGAATGSRTIALFVVTLVLLFVPRLLGVWKALFQSGRFGGALHLLLSALLETILSMLLAPVLAVFHSLFVVLTLFGLQIKWTNQNRADTGLSVGHCLKTYGWMSLAGLAAQALAFNYLGSFGWWLMPVFCGWILAPVLAWITSMREAGDACRRAGLFITPEEVEPPHELAGLANAEDALGHPQAWTGALLSPYVQAVHLSLIRQRPPNPGEAHVPAQTDLRERVLGGGPGAVGGDERLRLLWDAESLVWLHHELWTRPDAGLHPAWRRLQADSAASPLLTRLLTPRRFNPPSALA
jgi:membrane glycosyltransferase